MNLKIVAVIVGIAIAMYGILTLTYFEQNDSISDDSISDNAGMLGNSEDVSKIVTALVEYAEDLNGFLAKPDSTDKHPGIVMIHEWWGLNDNIKNMARQMATDGYLILAVDLYNGEVATDPTIARELTSRVRNNPDIAIQNMKSAVSFLRNHESVNSDAIGSLGWCFGGGMSLQLALNEEMAATGVYYGSLVNDPTLMSVIEWPVLGIFGSEDMSIPIDQVKAFEAGLNANNVENEIYIYDGVGHAFANPSGQNYAPEQSKDAWKKTIEFFDKHLK